MFSVGEGGYVGVPIAFSIVASQPAKGTIGVLPQYVYTVASPTSAE
jgi:hypothetical protein